MTTTTATTITEEAFRARVRTRVGFDWDYIPEGRVHETCTLLASGPLGVVFRLPYTGEIRRDTAQGKPGPSPERRARVELAGKRPNRALRRAAQNGRWAEAVVALYRFAVWMAPEDRPDRVRVIADELLEELGLALPEPRLEGLDPEDLRALAPVLRPGARPEGLYLPCGRFLGYLPPDPDDDTRLVVMRRGQAEVAAERQAVESLPRPRFRQDWGCYFGGRYLRGRMCEGGYFLTRETLVENGHRLWTGEPVQAAEAVSPAAWEDALERAEEEGTEIEW